MPAVSKQQHFEVLRTVLALAEERGSVPLADAAVAAGVSVDALRALLDPVLYLEFPATNTWVSEVGSFLLTSDDVLAVQADGHWLRDLEAAPPDPDTALRLLLAGLAMQSVASEPTPGLDRALTKLRQVLSAELRIGVDRPAQLGVAQAAWRDGVSLRFRYVAEGADVVSEREAVPYRVFCKWGHWYFQGRELDEPEPKQFRVDRMVDAQLGEVTFDPPPDAEIPEWFDLAEFERTVTLRLTREQLAALPRPHRVEREADLADGRVETDVVVIGERRLDYLLVCLDPTVDVVTPGDAARQRAHAARLLAWYRSPPT
jgi:predicted DNA-binding transcriptional regulator YafY